MMTALVLSLSRILLPPQGTARLSRGGPTALLVHQGDLTLDTGLVRSGEGILAPAGGLVSNAAPLEAEILAFTLADAAVDGAQESKEIDASLPCLFRLDEVAFPPGAQAYRHIHAGPGFRHLRWGSLALDADDHSFDVTPGDTWFEAAHSPVRAVASVSEPETRFVRAMMVPPQYAGKPTIQILDPKEAVLPKRQVTHRHVDHLIDRWPYVEAG